jgi:hypothetical protein
MHLFHIFLFQTLPLLLFNPLLVSSFLNPFSESQVPLNDVIALSNFENFSSNMAEHDGFRTVAYFVNWVYIQSLSYNDY